MPALETVAVAVESSYGSPAATSPVPDVSGLTFVSGEFIRAEAVYDGQETPNVDLELTRSSVGRLPPEPVTVNVAGSPQPGRKIDAITLEAPIRGIGAASAFATYDLIPIMRCLNTALGFSDAGADTDIVVGGTDANNFEPTTAANMAAGRLFQWTENGRVEYSAVTEISSGSGNDLTCSPALSGTPGAGDVMRLCAMFGPTLGTNLSLGASVAIRFDMLSHRFIAVGCRCRRAAFELRDGLVYVTVEMVPGLIIDDDGSASMVDPTVADGTVATFLGSYFVYSDAIGTATAPYALGRNVLNVGSWSLEIAFEWQRQGGSRNQIGLSALELADVEATLSIERAELDSTLRTDFINSRKRNIMVGCGRQGVGNGFCVSLGAAHLVNDSLPQEGENGINQQRATWRAGQYSGDTPGTSQTANLDLAIGFVR